MALWHLGDQWAADIVVIAGVTGSVNAEVLLIERLQPPFQGCWALPGGFVESSTPPGEYFCAAETPVQAAVRELYEETALVVSEHDLQQVGVYDAWGRDPRAEGNQRVISYCFLYVCSSKPPVQAGDDARVAAWHSLDKVLAGQVPLAFDHLAMLQAAVLLYQMML